MNCFQLGEDRNVSFRVMAGMFVPALQSIQNTDADATHADSRAIFQPFMIDRSRSRGVYKVNSLASLMTGGVYAVPLDRKNGACDSILGAATLSHEWE